MNEYILQSFWKYQLLPRTELTTAQGQSLKIISPGLENCDSGPDFFYAKIELDQQCWVGNIEIHLNSSDWFKHHHETDLAYQSIILHVVWHHDVPVCIEGHEVPTLILSDYVPKMVLEQYTDMVQLNSRPGCSLALDTVPQAIVSNWMERMFFERMEEKVNRLKTELEKNGNNLAQVFWEWSARYLGGPVNGVLFECLAKTITWKLLYKYRDRPKCQLALLFGSAGFLSEAHANTMEFASLWKFLKIKHQLTIPPLPWKYMRMHPAAFPNERMKSIYQFVLQLLPHAHNPELMIQLARREAHFPLPALGASLDNFLPQNKNKLMDFIQAEYTANVLIPLLFIRSELHADEISALAFNTKAENNKYTRYMVNNRFPNDNLMQSQALIHLHHHFCSKKKCLNCAIGVHLLRRGLMKFQQTA